MALEITNSKKYQKKEKCFYKRTWRGKREHDALGEKEEMEEEKYK
jgi:hypothetical protein